MAFGMEITSKLGDCIQMLKWILISAVKSLETSKTTKVDIATNAQKLSYFLKYYLRNSVTEKRNIWSDVGATLSEKLRRSYYSIIDRFQTELDRRFTSNEILLDSLDAFDQEPEKFMDYKIQNT